MQQLIRRRQVRRRARTRASDERRKWSCGARRTSRIRPDVGVGTSVAAYVAWKRFGCQSLLIFPCINVAAKRQWAAGSEPAPAPPIRANERSQIAASRRRWLLAPAVRLERDGESWQSHNSRWFLCQKKKREKEGTVDAAVQPKLTTTALHSEVTTVLLPPSPTLQLWGPVKPSKKPVLQA